MEALAGRAFCDSLASYSQTLSLLQKELPFLESRGHQLSKLHPKGGIYLFLVCQGEGEGWEKWWEVKIPGLLLQLPTPRMELGGGMWGQKRAGKLRQWGGGSPMWWITATFPEGQDLLTLPPRLNPILGARCLFDLHSKCLKQEKKGRDCL